MKTKKSEKPKPKTAMCNYCLCRIRTSQNGVFQYHTYSHTRGDRRMCPGSYTRNR